MLAAGSSVGCGAFFSQEYALEAAALFNPSIVACCPALKMPMRASLAVPMLVVGESPAGRVDGGAFVGVVSCLVGTVPGASRR